MCLGIPGEIIEITPDRPDLAVVDVVGVRRTINIALLTEDEAKPGAWVLVHVGFAMSRIDELEAAATLEMLAGLGQAYTDELDALARSDIG
jgi:hydrogenase expression/formation protein HypC